MKEARPELGWFRIPGIQQGKNPLARQAAGLNVIRKASPGASVLDLGCAEGLVSLDLAKAGARLVHGVDLVDKRVRIAEGLFAEQAPNVTRRFVQYDLSKLDDLVFGGGAEGGTDPPLRGRYDIVLCLAIAHKLPNSARFLRLAATLCANLMAIRLPASIEGDERMKDVSQGVPRLLEADFELIQSTEAYPGDLARPYQAGDSAWLGIFRRRA